MGDYEKEQARLNKLMQEAFIEYERDSDEEFDDLPSDSDDDVLETRRDDSETEQEISDEEDSTDDEENPLHSFIGKDGVTLWGKTVPPKNVRNRSENIVTRLPISKLPTRSLKQPLEIWNYFIDDSSRPHS